MNNILSLFKQNDNINELINNMKGSEYSLFCTGLTVNTSALLTSALYNKKEEYYIVVCSNEYKANVLYDKVTDVLGYENVNLYVMDDFAAIEALVVSPELKQERLSTLISILERKPKIIITHVGALLRPLLSLKRFSGAVINLKVGNELDVKTIVSKLSQAGYIRVHTTVTQGEFSIRGEVIDVFPCACREPIRINLAFDEIENIKKFDPTTQLTTKEKLDEINIYPMNEIIVDFDINEFQERLMKIENSSYVEEDFIKIHEYGANEKLFKYISYIDENHCSLFDYLNELNLPYSVIYNELKDLEEANEKLNLEVFEYMSERTDIKKLDIVFYNSFIDVRVRNQKELFYSNMHRGYTGLKLMGIYDFNSYKVTSFQSDIKVFIEYLKEEKKKTYITFQNRNGLDLVKAQLKENQIDCDEIDDFFELTNTKVSLILCDNAIGYGMHGYNVLTESEIYKKTKSTKEKYRSVSNQTTQINTKEDLVPGDYVVHYDYGIGKYLGIKTVELNNVKNDYLQLQYSNMDLLVPIEKITDLEKYLGSEGVVPKLTKIGTNEWEKKKQTIRSQLESIAKDLIELHVKRETTKGHVYCKDSEMQELFENDFEYEETEDQKKIISEIKDEMEKGVLIDRLVCGDVGFGKTEIALRIAFKTVYEGKQVAYLAPTTILSRQHFQTFQDRCAKYGIKVALLNRLVQPNVQKQVIKDLKDGKIDIVVGTHRLLNSEIKYKDLGLLIIDEEQRFGVEHKEKIKRIKTNVNVLTLTATPIPRTLQMAVTGIRTLSLMETPPKDRYPIQTYVLEHNNAVIKEAIYRELARNGQVFYLHNRISDIYNVEKKIQKLVPEARICVGHGKMSREELEDVITKFIDGEYNVMLCTTIIETGIDIPNSNTLIVEDASRLGLAQMYQIRGRVGRSDRIAYAYFTYDPTRPLRDTSQKRLAAIKEYNKSGSGYRIAVRDLAIRGAGDILGKEQSGFVNSVGIDMYMKLLNEAVNKIKGIEEKQKINYRIDVSKHVEREYVSDDSIIIYIHKEINSIETKEDKINTINVLTDRFGKLSTTVLDYVEERYLEALLRKMDVKKIKDEETYVEFTIPREYSSKLKGDVVLMAAYKISDAFNFNYRNYEFEIILNKKSKDKAWLYIMTQFLEKIII